MKDIALLCFIFYFLFESIFLYISNFVDRDIKQEKK